MNEIKISIFMKLISKQATEGSSVAGTPEKKGRTYTREQLKKRLLDFPHIKDVTLDQTAPRAFELSASGASPQRPDSETRLSHSLNPILDQLEQPNNALIQKQGRLLEKLSELSKKDLPKE